MVAACLMPFRTCSKSLKSWTSPPRAEAMAIRQYGVADSSTSLRQNCIHDVAHPNDLQVGC